MSKTETIRTMDINAEKSAIQEARKILIKEIDDLTAQVARLDDRYELLEGKLDVPDKRRRLAKVGARLCITEDCLDEPEPNQNKCLACQKQEVRGNVVEWAAQYR
jgi:hypothetical protein